MDDLKPGVRVKLIGFDNAYVPPEPKGVIDGYDGSWWGVIFDENVRFAQDHGDGLVPSKPHYGFSARNFEQTFDGICASCDAPVYHEDYLCESCRLTD